MKNIAFLFITILSFLIFACEDKFEEPADIDLGRDYFPTEIGKTYVYIADSTIYDYFADTITKKTFYIQEYFESEFLDNENRTAIRIERSYKDNLADEWQLKDVWFAVKTNNLVERNEENVRFIKLAFPASVGNTWDGNVFIETEENENLEQYHDWNYEITSNTETYENGDLSFNNVLKVVEIDDENLLDRRFSTANYAKGVGLVSKEIRILEFLGEDLMPEILWPDRANNGTILTQKLIEFY